MFLRVVDKYGSLNVRRWGALRMSRHSGTGLPKSPLKPYRDPVTCFLLICTEMEAILCGAEVQRLPCLSLLHGWPCH